MSPEPKSVFLERRAYRQRRLADGARMLPILGVVCFCVPLLWTLSEGQVTRTTYVMTFLFVVWVLLIGISGFVSSRLPKDTPDQTGNRDA